MLRAMARGVALFLVGSLVLVALLGCGRWFEQRDPWRHDAEVECLQSGAVREGPSVTRMSPIAGPGVCGADFPLKVAALGSGPALGFADDPRPPGAIPGSAPPPAYPREFAVEPPYPPYQRQPAAPMTLDPGPDPSPAPERQPLPDPPYPTWRGGNGRPAPQPYGSQVPLGPRRDPALAIASGPAAVAPAATLACPMVSALDLWVANAVQPAAQRWFGEPVIEIKQISAYSCRSMNGQRGAPISEHAFGNALDVAAFTLADGRRVTVKDGWHGPPEERGFLHDVQAAACRQFSTVLAPGSNAFHYDHIHVDLARHASGRGICNPAAIPGDVAAGRGRDPAFTGSVHAGARGPLPAAMAGED
jgi:Extensin-like protein C-terminus